MRPKTLDLRPSRYNQHLLSYVYSGGECEILQARIFLNIFLVLYGFDTNSTSTLQNVCFLMDFHTLLPFGGHLMVVVVIIGRVLVAVVDAQT